MKQFRLPALVAFTFVAAVGCQMPSATPKGASLTAPPAATSEPELQRLRPGDSLKITFPGAPNLDTAQIVRVDGRITMQIIGDILAAGLTPAELKAGLVEKYAGELVSKAIDVQVVSSPFYVYVTGATNKQGKIESTRPLTALEAIMEAGGYDRANANMKKVSILRNEGGAQQTYTVDLQALLDGRTTELFPLKSGDIVNVPDKFKWL